MILTPMKLPSVVKFKLPAPVLICIIKFSNNRKVGIDTYERTRSRESLPGCRNKVH